MSTQDYIWVRSTTGTVIGFPPEDIARFEREYDSLVYLGIDRWEYFSFIFRDELNGQRVTGYSTLWHFEAAWNKLEELLAE